MYDMHMKQCPPYNVKGCVLCTGCVDANGNVYIWGPLLRQPLTQAASEALEPKLMPGVVIASPHFMCGQIGPHQRRQIGATLSLVSSK